MVAERAFENKRIGQASAESNCNPISLSLESYLRLLTGTTENGSSGYFVAEFM